MWNFGIPYKLKHFIDIIMQPGYLFKYTSKGPVGLAGGKKLYLISSRGSDYSPGSAFHDFDHIGRYFETIFKFIGLEDYRFIDVQPMDAQGPDIRNAQIKRAVETVEKLI
jgi:FMN-dependent NADH-azoreductase